MKEFSSELVQSYETYSFGYCNYCEREASDVLAEIYNKGYLPYTNLPSKPNLYYMARSIRVPLKNWAMNSENRRVYGKFSDLEYKKHAVADFDITNQHFLDFCTAYFAQRHGSNVMPEERILHMLKNNIIKCFSYLI